MDLERHFYITLTNIMRNISHNINKSHHINSLFLVDMMNIFNHRPKDFWNKNYKNIFSHRNITKIIDITYCIDIFNENYSEIIQKYYKKLITIIYIYNKDLLIILKTNCQNNNMSYYLKFIDYLLNSTKDKSEIIRLHLDNEYEEDFEDGVDEYEEDFEDDVDDEDEPKSTPVLKRHNADFFGDEDVVDDEEDVDEDDKNDI